MIKDFLLKLYLLPITSNERLAMSLRNRLFPNHQHLKGLTFIIKNLQNRENFGNTIIDVGCFNGSTSVFLQKELKDVNIIGFEASKQSFKNAIEKTKMYPAIKIENYAVSDFCGTTEFYVTDNELSSSLNPLTGTDKRFSTTEVEQVNTITLDEYFKRQAKDTEKVLAIKLDVQGHELKVLQGARSSLKKTLFVLAELSNHDSYMGGSYYYEVDQFLRENGFVLHNIFAPFSYDPFLYEFDSLYINTLLTKN